MIVQYGYMDGSGQYFISIDTDKCATCSEYGCIQACPQSVFEIITDDYDDRVCAVHEEHRKSLKYVCSPCKPVGGWRTLACLQACTAGAIQHSW